MSERDRELGIDRERCSDADLLILAARELEDLDACTSVCDSRIIAPRLRLIAMKLRTGNPSLNEALNSGNGTYRP